jgi:hypothetical protein
MQGSVTSSPIFSAYSWIDFSRALFHVAQSVLSGGACPIRTLQAFFIPSRKFHIHKKWVFDEVVIHFYYFSLFPYVIIYAIYMHFDARRSERYAIDIFQFAPTKSSLT